MEIWYLYLLLGIVAGVVSVSLGIGAGSVIVPSLVILMSFPQKSAQGIALAVMVPMALVGGLRYWLNPDITVDLRVAALIAGGGVLGAFFGFYLPAHLSGDVLRKIFAVFMIVVAVRMLWPKSKPQSPPPDPSPSTTDIRPDESPG